MGMNLKQNTMETLNFLDELGVSASMIVMSNLSDAQVNLEYNFNPENSRLRLDFSKWLIIKLDGNLNQRIDANRAFAEFGKWKGINL